MGNHFPRALMSGQVARVGLATTVRSRDGRSDGKESARGLTCGNEQWRLLDLDAEDQRLR